MNEANRYRLPLVFATDHIFMGECAPRTVIEKVTTRYVYATLTAEQVAEMLSDARYYASEARYMGRDYYALGRSAAATVRVLS